MPSSNADLYTAETFEPTLDYVMNAVYTRAVPMAGVGFFLLMVMIIGQCPCFKRTRVKDTSKPVHATLILIATILWAAVIGAAVASIILEPPLHSTLTGIKTSFDNVLAMVTRQETYAAQFSQACTNIINLATTASNAITTTTEYKTGLNQLIADTTAARNAVDTETSIDNIRESINKVLDDSKTAVDMLDTYSVIAILSLAGLSILLSTIMFPVAVTQATRRFTGPFVEKSTIIVSAFIIFIAYSTAAGFLLLATISADFCQNPFQNAITAEEMDLGSTTYYYLTCNPANTLNATTLLVDLGVTTIMADINAISSTPGFPAAISTNAATLTQISANFAVLFQCSTIRTQFEISIDYLCVDLLDAFVNVFLTTLITASIFYLLYIVTRKLPVNTLYAAQPSKEKQDTATNTTARVLKKGSDDGIDWRIVQSKRDAYVLYLSKETHSDFVAYTEWNNLIKQKSNGQTPVVSDPTSSDGAIIHVTKCNNITFTEIISTQE